jgi:23S rRNA (cytosine1962-C5)-methyltransferase
MTNFKRIYHGRGVGDFFTIDKINKTLFIQLYEDKKINLDNFVKTSEFENIIFKQKWDNKTYAIKGKIPKEDLVIENGIKFIINYINQNIGYFGDMANTRDYLKKISKDKKVLNLFAYSCGFSLFALSGGAKEVINVDMSKSALKLGMRNHSINNLSGAKFWRLDILKSHKKLLKHSPYDIVILDPPTFQKSFIAKRDYEKLVKKIASYKPKIVIAANNDPKTSLDQFLGYFKDYKLKTIIPPPKEYINSSLKVALFTL